MANEKRLIEIPADGIVRIPIMDGDSTVGERAIDLSHMPTVDAVEVVRCKDCKYWSKEKDLGMFCNHWGSMLTETLADDFCSYGERKDNG